MHCQLSLPAANGKTHSASLYCLELPLCCRLDPEYFLSSNQTLTRDWCVQNGGAAGTITIKSSVYHDSIGVTGNAFKSYEYPNTLVWFNQVSNYDNLLAAMLVLFQVRKEPGSFQCVPAQHMGTPEREHFL